MWSSIFHSIFHGMRDRDAMMLLAAGGVALFVGGIGAWLGAHFGARRAVKRAFRDRIDHFAAQRAQFIVRRILRGGQTTQTKADQQCSAQEQGRQFFHDAFFRGVKGCGGNRSWR